MPGRCFLDNKLLRGCDISPWNTLYTSILVFSLCNYPQFSVGTHSLVLEELGKLVTGLISVRIALPVVWHVVDVSQDDPKQLLRTKHHVLIRNKRPEERKRGGEGGKVKRQDTRGSNGV